MPDLSCLSWYLRVHESRYHSIGERHVMKEAQEWGDAYAGECDGVGRTVTQQGQRALPTIIAPPPGPAPPRFLGATRSSPWPGTDRQQRRARCGPAPAGRWWHTACPGPGDSAPGAGACRVPRLGPGRPGSGPRPARPQEARAVPRCRRAGAGHTPGSRVPDAHGPAPARPWHGPGPPPGDRLPAAPPLGKDHRAPVILLLSVL